MRRPSEAAGCGSYTILYSITAEVFVKGWHVGCGIWQRPTPDRHPRPRPKSGVGKVRWQAPCGFEPAFGITHSIIIIITFINVYSFE